MVLTLPTCFDIYYLHSVIMAALWNRGGHYILVLWFLLSFSLAYFQLSQIGCLPYFHTWCGLIANLECRSEMCCTQLTENTGRKKLPKIHHLGTIALLGCTFATKACINNRKKNLSNSNISSTCPHNMVNFSPLAAEIGLPVWDTPANFNRFRVLALLLQWRHSTVCLLCWYNIYTFLGVLPSNGILQGAKIHSTCKSCILLYWQCYCTALQ